MKIANIDREILHNFWTTWRISMKFSGKMWLMITLKVIKTQGFTLSIEDTLSIHSRRFRVNTLTFLDFDNLRLLILFHIEWTMIITSFLPLSSFDSSSGGGSSWLHLLLSPMTLHKKWRFPLRISSVNVTKSGDSCGFGHIHWKNP